MQVLRVLPIAFVGLLLALLGPSAAFAADEQAAPAQNAAQPAPAKASEAGAAPAAETPATQPPAAEGGAGQTPAGDVVARIGDEAITKAEFDKELNRALQSRQVSARRQGVMDVPPLSDEDRQRFLDGMVDTRVLRMLAEKAKTAVTDEEVNQEVAKVEQSMPAEVREKQGLTSDELKKRVGETMMMRKFVQEQTKDIAVPEEELKAQYDKLKEQGRLDTADVAHILVKVEGKDDAAWAAGKEKIEAARKRILAGETFADVAKEVSEDSGSAPNGGAYPKTPRGRMVPQFDKVMFEIPIGEVSEPFRTQYGWHMLTVTARGALPFEEVSKNLSNQMLAPKRQAALKDLVTKAKEGMKIEVTLPPSEAKSGGLELPLMPERSTLQIPREDKPKEEAPAAQEPT